MLLLGGAAIAPVALVAFDPCVVIANASLIFLRMVGIPKATTVPAPTSFINSRLEILLSFKLSCSSDIICKKLTRTLKTLCTVLH